MHTPILATKMYIPRLQPKAVSRPRLLERLNEGLHRRSTLISAPAGFGKTTLVSQWVALIDRPTAWLSLDEADSDPSRFLAYLVAALQTIAPALGEMVVSALHSSQPPQLEPMLTTLLNEMNAVPNDFVLVLDDYHVLDARPIDQVLSYLVEHLPPQMHLVIVTREDPPLPLSRLRARGHLTEVRAADLLFTASEAAAFLNQVMGLRLSAEDVAALERRTEGWIAGLHLAALSLQRHEDPTSFIRSFTGSHHLVLDYLLQEVLGQQPEHIQIFLLRTSILDRMSGPLCDAVVLDSSGSGQETLEYLEHANLFLVPLDDERCWYRYHQLFAELLRQRLRQSIASPEDEGGGVSALHLRASQWYEDQGLSLEAFQHATAAHDVERATRLIKGDGMPLHFRGAVTPVLHWLESLPKTVLDGRPALWVIFASTLTMTGFLGGVEEKLQAAEAAMQVTESDDTTRDVVGQIAAIRAMLAVPANKLETMIAQSHRALEYLHPGNLASRTSTLWTLGFASLLQGDRVAARQAYTEAISLSQAAGNFILYIGATIGLGTIQEADTQLYLAAETYWRVLHLSGDLPQPPALEAHLGLAHVLYEWNDLEAALAHGQQSINLARPLENIDKCIAGEVVLARLKLAQGDVAGAAALLAEASLAARQYNLVFRMPKVVEAQVLTLLRRGSLSAAAQLAQTHGLPLSQARVYLAQGDTSAALAALSAWREQVEARGWQDELLKVMVLQAVALQAHGEQDQAVYLLLDTLALAEPGGFIRLFVDEGRPMAHLLSKATALGRMPDYTGKLLVALEAEEHKREGRSARPAAQLLLDPLSPREVEVLQLMALGLSNQEMGERLVLALDTVKGHNKKIFGKLHVQRRTEAVARARELGLL